MHGELVNDDGDCGISGDWEIWGQESSSPRSNDGAKTLISGKILVRRLYTRAFNMKHYIFLINPHNIDFTILQYMSIVSSRKSIAKTILLWMNDLPPGNYKLETTFKMAFLSKRLVNLQKLLF